MASLVGMDGLMRESHRVADQSMVHGVACGDTIGVSVGAVRRR
jgi:hypothetical protein